MQIFAEDMSDQLRAHLEASLLFDCELHLLSSDDRDVGRQYGDGYILNRVLLLILKLLELAASDKLLRVLYGLFA